MIYLSRLILNPRSRQVRNELADPYEMHRTIMKAFPAANYEKGQPSGVLFRVEVQRTGVPTLLVQSLHKPRWEEIPNPQSYLIGREYLPFGEVNPAEKEVDLNHRLCTGQQLAFRLQANPTKRDAKSRKRVGLYKEEEQLEWLKRKFEWESAAKLISARIGNEKEVQGKLFHERNRIKRMKFHTVQFEGILQVDNQEIFLEMLKAGIGSGKGFGFGLLSIAPALMYAA